MKAYRDMTPAERTADRIRKNQNIREDVRIEKVITERRSQVEHDRKVGKLLGEFVDTLHPHDRREVLSICFRTIGRG